MQSFQPLITNDAITFGILMTVLALVFHTSRLETSFWKKFYVFVPALLLCYFVPALLNWPLGLIAPHWYDDSIHGLLSSNNIIVPDGLNYDDMTSFLKEKGISSVELKKYQKHSQLYFVASRYLLPASLILLCLSIDFKGILGLGWKAIVMFLAGTLGIVIGGPIALMVSSSIMPSLDSDGQLWTGLATIAGSWIGGGANQTAMKEIFEVSDGLFAKMIVVDVIVANIWMGFLLWGANNSKKIDSWLKADDSAIVQLKESVSEYRASIQTTPTKTDLFILLAIAFGGVGLSHWGSEIMTEFMGQYKEQLMKMNLTSLTSGFFWLIVFSTTIGLILSFTKAKKLEGIGASTWGGIFIYILVATIGMKMNIGDVIGNPGLFAIGVIWMIVHVIVLLIVAKVIKAPFFYVAVGSQANVGGAASAPIVASAFDSALAPVGVLMAVLGYALGTYGALLCAQLMASL